MNADLRGSEIDQPASDCPISLCSDRRLSAFFRGQESFRFLDRPPAVGPGVPRSRLASLPVIVHSALRLILLSRIDGDAPRAQIVLAPAFWIVREQADFNFRSRSF